MLVTEFRKYFHKMVRFHFHRALSIKLFFGLVGSALVLWFVMGFLVQDPAKSAKNYFNDLDRFPEGNTDLLINTSNCLIPNFSPWDSAVVPLLKKGYKLNCPRLQELNGTKAKGTTEGYNWSSVLGNKLVLNSQQMRRDGFIFQTEVVCCYKAIERVEMSLSKYDEDADNRIKLSSCINVTNQLTVIKSEFIQVECRMKKKGIGNETVIYKAYHGSALTKDIQNPKNKKFSGEKTPRKPSLLSKLNHWKNQKVKMAKGFQPPPNILIIGQDSTSRLNFKRNMNETRRVLESLGAVEMLGYVKVGENTFPNMCPILAGYPEKDFRRLCNQKQEMSMDNCPFIFRRFDEAKYLTTFVEDAPFYAIFNYKRTGFVHQPADFYVRPLFIGALGYGIVPEVDRTWNLDCIGPQTNDETIINYLKSALDFADKHSSPLFALSWSTTLTHENINAAKLADSHYANLLERIEKKGYLNNTILIFMGDHGYRYGPIRETLIGYYEDRLPNMWIRIPPKLKTKYPQWQEALRVNSLRLSSPYVLYWTLQTLLEEFSPDIKPVVDEKTHEGKIIQRPPARYSFLEEIPEEASCKDLGIPEQYCPCYSLHKVSLKDPMLRKAAKHSIDFINKEILKGTQCCRLSLVSVTAGAKMTIRTIHVSRYIVGFFAKPGSMLIESHVDFFLSNSTFSVSPVVQRMNKLNASHIDCAGSPTLELFCFCRKSRDLTLLK